MTVTRCMPKNKILMNIGYSVRLYIKGLIVPTKNIGSLKRDMPVKHLRLNDALVKQVKHEVDRLCDT